MISNSYPPRAIIIDLKLPRMNGFDLISHIRDIDRYKSVPIIVISSSSQPSDISRAFEVRVMEYINKLTAMDHLAERIKAFI
jgi:DNA-binding response OmpR family regulator